MRLLAIILVGVLAVGPWARLRAQDRDVRFAISTVGDTTVTFRVSIV